MESDEDDFSLSGTASRDPLIVMVVAFIKHVNIKAQISSNFLYIRSKLTDYGFSHNRNRIGLFCYDPIAHASVPNGFSCFNILLRRLQANSILN